MDKPSRLELIEEYLTAEELSSLFKVNKNTIYAWVSRREIPFIKLPGNVTRFQRQVVMQWLEKRSATGKNLSRGVYLSQSENRRIESSN